jgi:RNA polymerase sigma factor (sigma-70 family)
LLIFDPAKVPDERYNVCQMSVPGEATAQDNRGPRATQSEKLAALNALTHEDYGRFLKYAEWTAAKFTGRVNDADAEDLLNEAVVRVLDERNWYPQKADFRTFFRGVIRSIASDWYKHSHYTESPDTLLSPSRHDEETEAAITLDKFRERLRDRPHALEIFDLKRNGMTAREIMERLGIRKEIYLAAVKWIQRTLRKRGSGNE